MLADQHMQWREENFTVFMYVLRSIVTPWWTTKFPRSKPCTRLLLYLSLAGFLCGFSLLVHRWPMLEMMRKTLCLAILVAMHKGSFSSPEPGILWLRMTRGSGKLCSSLAKIWLFGPHGACS